MKIFIALSLINLTLAMPNSPNTPKITVQQDRSISTIPKIDIVFPNGHEDKMILKRHHVTENEEENQELNCNFLGHLEKDREACLAVTGCPGQEMEFTIHSRHNVETNKYVLLPSGNVEPIAGNQNDMVESITDPKLLGLDRASESSCTINNITGCKPLPPTSEIKLKVCN